MNETPQEESQSFSEYISLGKKLEKAVQEIPKKKGEDEVIEEREKKPIEEEIEDSKQEQENSLEEVEERAKEIKQESLSEEEKDEGDITKIEELLLFEKELLQAYSGTKVQVSDFFYEIEELEDSEIGEIIKTKMQSLSNIRIDEKLSLGYPFALCKIDSKFKILVPIEIDQIELPTFLTGTKKQLKLLNSGDKNQLNLSPKDSEIWDQAFNQFQLKFAQVINQKSKDKLRKDQPTNLQLLKLDGISIKEFISTYEKNAKLLKTYYNDIIANYEKLEEKIKNKISFWEDKEEFSEAVSLLQEKIEKIREKHASLSKETQVEYLKLRRTQKQLDGKTTRYKIDEKRGKKITREEKEVLIKRVREFQKKKQEISKDIKETKEIEETLLKWIEIIEIADLEEANNTILDEFGRDIKNNIVEILKEKEFEKIAEKVKNVESILEDISIHVIYVPASIYTFTAKQGDQKITGKLLYLALTEDSVFLK